MKCLPAAGFFLLLANAALGQPAPGTPGGPPPGPPGAGAHPSGPPPEGMEMRHPGHGMMGMHHMLGRGAAVMLRRGDAVMALKCADDDSTKACVDAALTLMEKARPGSGQ